MGLPANNRRVLERFLAYLLEDRPPIRLGDGRVVECSPTFRAESRESRKKRLRVLRARRKGASLSIEDQQVLEALERSSVYSSGDASVSQRKLPGKRAPNIEETKLLYVGKLVCKNLFPEDDPHEFLESNTWYENAAPDALENRMRRFENAYIATGKETCFQIVESLFRRFRQWEVAQRHAELYEGFPRLGIPEANIAKLTELMRITESEIKLLRSLCR
jgi:hypothetical protein